MNTAPQLASLFAAALAAYYLRFRNLQLEPGYLMAILSGLIIASIVIPATGALRPAFKFSPARVARRMLAGWSLVVTALVSMAAMLKVTADYSRIWFGYWVLFSAAALVVGPFARHIWTTRVRAHRSANRLVLVGTGQPLDTVLDRLNSTAGSEYELVAVFAADDGVHGIELWATDGTTAGTRMVVDLIPGAQGSNPLEMCAWNGLLFYRAYAPSTGYERPVSLL